MRIIQYALLIMFAVSAIATVFFQMRYGMICGRSLYEQKQDDPKALACRKKAGFFAVLAMICIVLCIIFGAISKK